MFGDVGRHDTAVAMMWLFKHSRAVCLLLISAFYFIFWQNVCNMILSMLKGFRIRNDREKILLFTVHPKMTMNKKKKLQQSAECFYGRWFLLPFQFSFSSSPPSVVAQCLFNIEMKRKFSFALKFNLPTIMLHFAMRLVNYFW